MINHYINSSLGFGKYLHKKELPIYLFIVNNRNSRKMCEIYSKLTIKTPERTGINNGNRTHNHLFVNEHSPI